MSANAVKVGKQAWPIRDDGTVDVDLLGKWENRELEKHQKPAFPVWSPSRIVISARSDAPWSLVASTSAALRSIGFAEQYFAFKVPQPSAEPPPSAAFDAMLEQWPVSGSGRLSAPERGVVIAKWLWDTLALCPPLACILGRESFLDGPEYFNYTIRQMIESVDQCHGLVDLAGLKRAFWEWLPPIPYGAVLLKVGSSDEPGVSVISCSGQKTFSSCHKRLLEAASTVDPAIRCRREASFKECDDALEALRKEILSAPPVALVVTPEEKLPASE